MLVSCSVHQGWNFLLFKEFIERKNKSTCDEKLIALFCQNDKSSFSAFFCMTVVNLSLWCVYFLYHSCRQSQLHYHNARQHDGQRPYPCTAAGCERKFYKKSDLKTHAKLHLGVKDHPCPICQRKFSHVSNLNRHLLTHKKAIIARSAHGTDLFMSTFAGKTLRLPSLWREIQSDCYLESAFEKARCSQIRISQLSLSLLRPEIFT